MLRPKPFECTERESKVSLVLDFHLSFSKVSSILAELQPIHSASSNIIRVFLDTPFASFCRSRNLKNPL